MSVSWGSTDTTNEPARSGHPAMIFLAPQEGCLSNAHFGGRPEARADNLSPAFAVPGWGYPRPPRWRLLAPPRGLCEGPRDANAGKWTPGNQWSVSPRLSPTPGRAGYALNTGTVRPRTTLRIPECGHTPYSGMNAGLSRIGDRWRWPEASGAGSLVIGEGAGSPFDRSE